MNFFVVLPVFLIMSVSFSVFDMNAQTVGGKGHYSIADTTHARQLLIEAKGLIAFQKNEEGLVKALKAKEIYEDLLGSENLEMAECWNRIGAAYLQTGRLPEAKLVWDTALKIRIKIAGEESLVAGNSYANMGIYYRETGDFDNALIYMQRGLALQLKFLPKGHSLLAGSYNNLGAVYNAKGRYDQAFEYFQKSLQAYIKLFTENNAQVAQIYANLGGTCQSKGDYDLALEYYEKSYRLFVKLVGAKHFYLATPLNNMAIAYQSKGEYDRSVTLLEKALDLRLQSQGKIHADVAQAYVNLANSWFFKNEPDRAIEYFEKAIAVYGQLPSAQITDIASTYNNLGLALQLRKDYSHAIEQHDKALELYLKSVGIKHPNVATAWYNIGQCYQQMGDYKLAYQAIAKAITGLNYTGVDSFSTVSSMPFLIKCLSNLATLQRKWFVGRLCPECLEQSHQNYLQAIAAISYESFTLSPTSKSNLSAEAEEVYASAMTTNYLLHNITAHPSYLSEGFDFSERSKAFLLFEALRESKSLKFADLPDTLLEQEYDRRVDIAYYDKKRQENLVPGHTDIDSSMFAINNKLFDLNRQYADLKAHFEKYYPKYFKARYDLSTVPVEDVQRTLLQPDQSLLEYLVGDSNIYIFLIRKDTFLVREIKRDFPLDEWVNDLTKEGIYGFYGLSKGNPEKTSARQKACDENYTRAAQQLYQKLLLPIEDQLAERVIIIPDGVLGYVPFEALLTKAPARPEAFSSYIGSYFMDKHQVSYSYSATLLREMQHEPDESFSGGSVLAMAPFFRRDTTNLLAQIDTSYFGTTMRDVLGPLDFSGQEVAAITKLWGGEPFYNKAASLEKFRELASNYRILHLSTHGKADDRQGDYAFLAFSTADDSTFSKLYARDLYNFSLHADLVMLSACETGIGTLRKGEGIVSLARAFAYAGAKSIFTTLWKVSDGNTIDLTVPFYKYLKNGWPKDKALRQAKLDYLQKHKGSGGAVHPFFWAGMIGIGDMGSMH